MSLLVGIGAFVTGEVNRFRPKIIGGLAGAAIGIGSFVFQEELWAWQMLALLDPLLHNELRLKIMAALDSLDDADFVYLKGLTGATSGNLSVQLTNLQDAGYIKVSTSGAGRGSHTVCRITPKGSAALQDYQKALMSYFSKK